MNIAHLPLNGSRSGAPYHYVIKAMPVVLSKEYLLYIQDINIFINTTNIYYV
jgi:hypothetical protein